MEEIGLNDDQCSCGLKNTGKKSPGQISMVTALLNPICNNFTGEVELVADPDKPCEMKIDNRNEE